MLYIIEPVYFNDVNIDRGYHNGGGLTTTGMNATQIATLKKNYTKVINIDYRITKLKIC